MPRIDNPAADHAASLAVLPANVRLIIERLPSPAGHALAVELTTLLGLHEAPDSVRCEARGAVRGHSHSAWLRDEVTRAEYELLISYANGLPV